MSTVRTNVYVDRFNLYYGALRDQPYKWLDLLSFSHRLLKPYNTVARIRYFTARVQSSPRNPNAPERQRAYLRALETIPNLSIHYGLFQMIPGQPPREKGSDVNLASYLLLDAFNREYQVALVISNDSDLTHSIELVRQRFGVRVVVATPVLNRHPNGKQRYPSLRLRGAADFLVKINRAKRSALRDSQLPNEVIHDGRTIVKPSGW